MLAVEEYVWPYCGGCFQLLYSNLIYYLPIIRSLIIIYIIIYANSLIPLQTEPDFDLDIKEDVQDECQKFGTVKHIFVDK